MKNFGKIKNVFNNLLAEAIVKKDDKTKKLFRKYIQTIKESEILKTQFLIYNNIETKIDDDVLSVSLYVSENIKLMDKYSHADIIKENKKLTTLLDSFSSNLEDTYELAELHDALSNLILTKRTPNNIDMVTDDIKKISRYVSSNQPKDKIKAIDLPVSLLTNIMVEKYNERYDTLNESDRKIIKVLLGTNDEDKKKLFNGIVVECTEMIDKLLIDANAESKEKLLKVKTKLLEDKQDINDTDFITRVSKLIMLKDNLNN